MTTFFPTCPVGQVDEFSTCPSGKTSYFGSDTPLLPLPTIPPPKEREDEEIALKFPQVLASCGPCTHPKQILSSALGNKLPLFLTGIC